MNDRTDEDLLAHIRDEVNSTDPLPHHVVDMAKAIPSMARIDVELAELLTPLVEVRDTDRAGLPLVFELTPLTVAVSLDDGVEVDIVGVQDATVLFETSGGQTVGSLGVENLFRPVSPLSGSVRVVVTTGDRRIATDWLTVVVGDPNRRADPNT